ncbi:MAG: hypothetical protein AB7P33_09855 [Dehalococcoidia bacterium]
MAKTKAKQYRALVGLSLPVDEAEYQRVIELTAAGKEVTDRKLVRYEPGEIPAYIPAGSAEWLLESGAIEEVTDG